MKDKSGFFYSRPDHKDWLFGGAVTEDGHYLIIEANHGTDPKNHIFYKDLTKPDAKVVELLPNGDAAYNFIGNDGATFWFRTDLAAPLRRIIAIDTPQPLLAKPNELVAESADKVESVSLLGERFVADYRKDAHSLVKLFKLDGAPDGEIALPGLGSAAGFTGKRRDRETFYSFTSFTTPTSIYRYDFEARKSDALFTPKVKFNPDDYTTEEVFYTTADGAKVPMFISYKKGLTKNGQNPTYLYGYGGLKISLTPSFNPANLVWMEMGGIYAVPNLRGGGEYGEKWHEDGMKHEKQNVFNDFIAAAQYLMWPFQKFTIGWAWASDYGSSDEAADFPYLYAYSPLHHIAPATKYPAILITTADHDDRVVPAHSFKFAATLQAAQAGSAPILIRIETKAGHGAGKPTTKIIDEIGDRWAFLGKMLQMDFAAPTGAKPGASSPND